MRELRSATMVGVLLTGCGGGGTPRPAQPAPASDAGKDVDCSEAYGGKPATCKVIACDARYASFVGEWKGPFEAYAQELKKLRPFANDVVYAAKDCLENTASHDVMILGRRTDTYPAFESLPAQTKQGLLITGRKADGTPFLRTVDDDGTNDYTLESQDPATERSVWTLAVPAAGQQPEMKFRIVDERDVSLSPRNVRNVSIELRVGPEAQPYWQGMVTQGHHEKQP